MKLEAIKHQGERSDLTSRQVGEKSQTSIQLVASQAGASQRQVQRYIRLTELIPELLDISQIETHLLTADCVVDVDGTTVNGDTKNIELAADEIPRLSTIGGAA